MGEKVTFCGEFWGQRSPSMGGRATLYGQSNPKVTFYGDGEESIKPLVIKRLGNICKFHGLRSPSMGKPLGRDNEEGRICRYNPKVTIYGENRSRKAVHS